MFKDLRIGWRQLVADPAYSAVVLLGLAVAIACCCLALQVVFNELLPDPELAEPARVVNFEFRGNQGDQEDNWFDQAPFVLATALRESHAPLVAVARSLNGHEYVVHVGDRQLRLGFEFADPEAIEVFSLRAVAGDLRAAFTRPDAVALTAEAARRVFPAGDAIGKTITVKNHVLAVVAITTVRQRGEGEWRQDAFVGFDSVMNHVDADTRTGWGYIQGKVFARLAPGATVAQLSAAAQALYEASPDGRRDSPPLAPGQPGDKSPVLRAIAMDQHYLHAGMGGRYRSRQFFALAGAALLMLSLAVANYINLTSVRTLARAREIAVRKTLGASPWRLTLQFTAESTLAAAAATAIGLLLAWWLAPALTNLLHLRLAADLFSPERLAVLLAGALLLGVLTGLYPARIAHSVNCGAALAGRSHDEGRVGRSLRRAMTALQFVIALVVSAAAVTMVWQNQYVASLPHGIRTTGLLTANVPDGFSGRSDALNLAFGDALRREPGVSGVAWSNDVPGRGESWTGVQLARAGAAPVRVSLMSVSLDFFPMYDVPLIAGRLRMPPEPPAAAASGAAAGPKPERLVVIDATTSRALGFASPREAVDQLLLEGDPKSSKGRDPVRIIGVSPDVRMEHAHEATRLHAMGLTRKPQETITAQGPDMAALRRAFEHVWPRFFPEDYMGLSTVEEAVGEPYEQEHRIAQMTLATTAIALLLSAFGVYALAAYTVRRSAREIVVRKLYGAGRARIARLIAGEFVPLLAVAAVVGLPVAAWLTSAWLASFTERAGWVMLALPTALVALVAMTALAALRHGFIAMNMRPTVALRG